jgi:DNA-binding NarL/FixJ family response regulator
MLCDDHHVVLEGVKSALSQYDELNVVGMCCDGKEAVDKFKKLKPEIVIMDISMPHFNGVEATHQIKKLDPDAKVIIFTMHSYQEFFMELMKAGISAYVLKQNPLSDLYLAIQVVQRGGTYFSEDPTSFLTEHVERLEDGDSDRYELLSRREREIFQLLAEGIRVKEAAKLLCLSPKTVETHKYHIMSKLRIRSMSEWTKEAIRRGLVQV